MKLINNISVLCMALLVAFSISSCTNDDSFVLTDDSVIDFTEFGVDYETAGALITVSDVQTGFFNLTDLANASIGFTVGAYGGDVTSVNAIISYNGQPSPLQSIGSLPSTLSVTLSDALAATGVSASSVKSGDVFTISFDDVTTPSGTFSSGTTLSVPVTCPSSLGGTHNYVSTNLQAEFGYGCPAGEVTGQITFTELGGGLYLASDLGFGQYGTSCWNDSPATSDNATFTDDCNKITSGGLDQYGLTYIWVITDVSGAELSISWSNNYGDSGDVVITKSDGSDWPALYTE